MHVKAPQPDSDDIIIFFRQIYLEQLNCQKIVQARHGRANEATQTKVNLQFLIKRSVLIYSLKNSAKDVKCELTDANMSALI